MDRRTPSPPRRLHTPPAPGASPNYHPYSPRRSSRVAAQREDNHPNSSSTLSHPSRAARETTPITSSRKKTTARASLQGLSPPSSPISPAKHRSPRSVRRVHVNPFAVDSDSDHAAPTPARRFLSSMAMESHGMLPTPAKTPRKRPLQSEESLRPTARVLFPNRPATVEEAMPSPRKARKNRRDAYTLESFAAQVDEDTSKIEIYTDSKERVPTADEDDDNPFVSKKSKGKAKAKSNGSARPRKFDPNTAKMQEAVNHDEGMIFMFRGKKIYRKFHDGPSHGSEEEPEHSSDELRHNAGPAARRPLTRSAIKPRLLFQEEIQQRNHEMGITDDEEAVTDIEISVTTPSNRKTRKVMEIGTPIKPQETTPPPTVRPKRQISFESWSRVKPSTRESSSSSRKRTGETLESTHDKRTRTR